MERWRTAHPSIGDPGAALSHVWKSQRGATLVELLTSTVFVSMLMAMSYGFARAALMSARVQEVKIEAQEAAIVSLDFLVRELRMAGFSAAGKPVTALRAAGQDRIEITCDLNGDGDTADPNEQIAYSYNGDKRQLMRATGGASPQPLTRNVPPGGVRFSFFDATGMELRSGDGGLSVDDRCRIHRIDVMLRVEIPNPDPNADGPLTSTTSASVCLRNQ